MNRSRMSVQQPEDKKKELMNNLPREEYRLVRKFRRLDDDAQERIMAVLDAALVSQTARKRDPELAAEYKRLMDNYRELEKSV